jgi:hypothetical protein
MSLRFLKLVKMVVYRGFKEVENVNLSSGDRHKRRNYYRSIKVLNIFFSTLFVNKICAMID